MFAAATLFAAARPLRRLLLLLALAPACSVVNHDHCANLEGDTTCQQRDPSRPFCSQCAGENNGCFIEVPPDTCHAVTVAAPGTSSTGTTTGTRRDPVCPSPTCPWVASPQHATVPSVFTPHVWYPPASTCVNVPGGGLAWPEVSSPQQVTVPSAASPHACANPALSAAKAPAGALAWPEVFCPQQTAVPSVRSPQLKNQPAATALNWSTTQAPVAASSVPW